MDDEVLKCFLLHAKKNAVANGMAEIENINGFWKFFAATIGHGIVDYAQEKDAYVGKNSDLSGLLKNSFLQSLHTLEEWRLSKEVWCMPRDELTAFFNTHSKLFWIPSQ